MALTNTTIRNLKPQQKPFKKADSKGLYVEIPPKQSKRWRFRYRFDGRENRLSLGIYPDVTLKEARRKRDELRTLATQGINPGEERKAHKASMESKKANTLEAVAKEWIAKHSPRWSSANTKKITSIFEKNIFPWIGQKTMTNITVQDLLETLKKIDERGASHTAHRALSDCNRVFRYGVVTGRVANNPCDNLQGALAPIKRGHFAAKTEPKELGPLLRMFDDYQGSPTVRCALKMAPLVFVRPGELRHMKWKDIDFEKKEWRYQVTKTKTEHIVPLARQTLEILQKIRPLTQKGTYVFHSDRSSERPLSDNALLAALRRMGIGKDELSIHGFRATARTILDEVLEFRPEYIEHQLAHCVKDPLGRAYNRTKHLEKRRVMMQKWADYLDGVESQWKCLGCQQPIMK